MKTDHFTGSLWECWNSRDRFLVISYDKEYRTCKLFAVRVSRYTEIRTVRAVYLEQIAYEICKMKTRKKKTK